MTYRDSIDFIFIYSVFCLIPSTFSYLTNNYLIFFIIQLTDRTQSILIIFEINKYYTHGYELKLLIHTKKNTSGNLNVVGLNSISFTHSKNSISFIHSLILTTQIDFSIFQKVSMIFIFITIFLQHLHLYSFMKS